MFSTFSSTQTHTPGAPPNSNLTRKSNTSRLTTNSTLARNESGSRKTERSLSNHSQFSRKSYGSGLNYAGEIIPKFGEDVESTLVPRTHRRNLINSVQKFFSVAGTENVGLNKNPRKKTRKNKSMVSLKLTTVLWFGNWVEKSRLKF